MAIRKTPLRTLSSITVIWLQAIFHEIETKNLRFPSSPAKRTLKFGDSRAITENLSNNKNPRSDNRGFRLNPRVDLKMMGKSTPLPRNIEAYRCKNMKIWKATACVRDPNLSKIYPSSPLRGRRGERLRENNKRDFGEHSNNRDGGANQAYLGLKLSAKLTRTKARCNLSYYKPMPAIYFQKNSNRIIFAYKLNLLDDESTVKDKKIYNTALCSKNNSPKDNVDPEQPSAEQHDSEQLATENVVFEQRSNEPIIWAMRMHCKLGGLLMTLGITLRNEVTTRIIRFCQFYGKACNWFALVMENSMCVYYVCCPPLKMLLRNRTLNPGSNSKLHNCCHLLVMYTEFVKNNGKLMRDSKQYVEDDIQTNKKEDENLMTYLFLRMHGINKMKDDSLFNLDVKNVTHDYSVYAPSLIDDLDYQNYVWMIKMMIDHLKTRYCDLCTAMSSRSNDWCRSRKCKNKFETCMNHRWKVDYIIFHEISAKGSRIRTSRMVNGDACCVDLSLLIYRHNNFFLSLCHACAKILVRNQQKTISGDDEFDNLNQTSAHCIKQRFNVEMNNSKRVATDLDYFYSETIRCYHWKQQKLLNPFSYVYGRRHVNNQESKGENSGEIGSAGKKDGRWNKADFLKEGF